MIQHSASMTHGPRKMSDKEREESGITNGLIRVRFDSTDDVVKRKSLVKRVMCIWEVTQACTFYFSVGIEDCNDIIADLAQALAKVS